MATNSINIRKVSGCITFDTGNGIPKSYYGSIGKFQPGQDGTSWNVTINLDSYNIPLSLMLINGQAPTSMVEANTLLKAIFGT